MLEQEDVSGVLKLNSKMLQPSDLRKLDKSEKGLLVEMGKAGKGEVNSNLDIPRVSCKDEIPIRGKSLN